jgi:hypothetical protein
LAVKVDGDDGSDMRFRFRFRLRLRLVGGLPFEKFFELLGVDVVRLRVYVYEDWNGATLGDGFGSGDEGERGSDNLVAGLDATGKKSKLKSISTGGNTNGISCAAIRSNLGF